MKDMKTLNAALNGEFGMALARADRKLDEVEAATWAAHLDIEANGRAHAGPIIVKAWRLLGEARGLMAAASSVGLVLCGEGRLPGILERHAYDAWQELSRTDMEGAW